MEDVKKSRQAVGAQVLTNLAGFAPPTILSQAARLQARQPFFNLVVTNVPGPQFPLYLLGRRAEGALSGGSARPAPGAGIAVMSYDGHLGFGLLGDYDALPELEDIVLDLKWAIASLARAANVARRHQARPRAARPSRRRAVRAPPNAPARAEPSGDAASLSGPDAGGSPVPMTAGM